MMSLEEIEAAIERLPPQDFQRLCDWIAEQDQKSVRPTEHPQRIGAAAGEFVIPESFWEPLPEELLDAFEGRS